MRHVALPGIRSPVVWLVWRVTSRMSALCRSCRCSFTHARQAFNQRSCRQSCSKATALLPIHTRPIALNKRPGYAAERQALPTAGTTS
jgi:hypothetical protein